LLFSLCGTVRCCSFVYYHYDYYDYDYYDYYNYNCCYYYIDFHRDRTDIFASGRVETDVDRNGVGLPTAHDRSISRVAGTFPSYYYNNI